MQFIMNQMDWVRVILPLCTSFCLFHGGLSVFLTRPNQTYALKDERVMLLCESDRAVVWFRGADQLDNGYGTITNSGLASRFSIDSTGVGPYNLVINPVQSSDANTFTCSEISGNTASANLTVLDSLPNCNTTASTNASNCGTALACTVSFHGAGLNLDIKWRQISSSNNSIVSNSVGNSATVTLDKTSFRGHNLNARDLAAFNGTYAICQVVNTNYTMDCPIIRVTATTITSSTTTTSTTSTSTTKSTTTHLPYPTITTLMMILTATISVVQLSTTTIWPATTRYNECQSCITDLNQNNTCIIVAGKDLTLASHYDVTTFCPVSDVPQDSVVQWYLCQNNHFENTLYANSSCSLIWNSSVLELNDLHPWDSGFYICLVTNPDVGVSLMKCNMSLNVPDDSSSNTTNCTERNFSQLQSVAGSTTIISIICICGMVVFILQLNPPGTQHKLSSKFLPIYFVFISILILSLIIVIGTAVVIANGYLFCSNMVTQWKIGVIVMYCCMCLMSIYGIIHTTVLLGYDGYNSFMKIFPLVFASLNLLVSVATLAWTLKVMEYFRNYSTIGREYFSWEVFLIALGCAVAVFIPLTVIWVCCLATRITGMKDALKADKQENNPKPRRPSTASHSKVDVAGPLGPDAKPKQSKKTKEGKSAAKPAPENISKPESNSASDGNNAGSPRRPLPPLNPSVPLVIKMPDQEATPRTNLPPIDPVEKTKKKKKSKKNSVDDNK